MTLTVRSTSVPGATTAGRALTHAEMDENWNHVANFIASGSGALPRALQGKAREVVSVLDYIPESLHASIADATNTTNLDTYIQSAANAALEIYFPLGTYLVNAQMTFRSCAKWRFANGATIKLAATFPLGTAVITNSSIASGLDTRSHSDVVFDGGTFDGNSIATRTAPFIELTKCTRPVVRNCIFQNHTYICVSDEGCIEGVYAFNKFINNGRTTAATPAIWAQSYTTDLTDTRDVTIAFNLIKNNSRSGIHCHARGGTVIGNTFDGCHESSIFMSGEGLGTDLCRDIRIIGNVIRDGVIDSVTSCGVEINNARWCVISGNTFDKTGTEALGIQNGNGIVISGNTIRDSGQGANSPAISLTSNATLGGSLKNIEIIGNTFREDQGTATQLYILKISHSGSGPANMTGFKMCDNIIDDGYDTTNGRPILFSSGSVRLGSDAIFKDFGNGQTNLLLNGMFTLTSRGSSFTNATTPANNDDTYLLDNWTLLSDGNNIVNLALDTTSPRSTADAGAKLTVVTGNKKFGLIQFIPAEETLNLRGKYVSLSCQLRKGGSTLTKSKIAILQWTGTADSLTSDVVSAWNAEDTDPTLIANWSYLRTPSTPAALTGAYETLREEGCLVGASANNLAVFIWSDDASTAAADELRIAQVKLRASVLPVFPMQDRLKREESILAKRYFERISADGVGDPFANGAAQGTGDFSGVLEHEPKRTTASYSFSGSTAFDVKVGGATVSGGTLTASAIGGAPYAKALLNVNKAAAFTSGQGGYIASSGASDYIDVSAEL